MDSILKAVNIITDSVKPFYGTRNYLSTGDLNISKISHLEIVSFESKPSRANLNVKEGDIILARMQGTVKSMIITEPFNDLIVSTGFIVLRPKKNVLDKYLFYVFKSGIFQKDKDKLCSGATQKAINNSNFKKIKIPLPPLSTQKRIAEILDNAAALRDKTQQLLDEYDQLAQSIFLDMFGDPVTNPKGWELISLGEAGELNRGKSKHRPRNAPELLGGKYPLIQTGDVSNSGGYIREYSSTYSELGLAQSRLWPKGTLCITIAANIARTSILTFDACFPDSIVGFVPNNRTNNEFVQYWMSFLQKIIEDKAPESAQKNINLKILKELEFYCPPKNLQNQFAEKIGLIEQQKDLAKQELQESEALFQALLQKAFKGDLI